MNPNYPEILEALLFSTAEPLTLEKMQAVFEEEPPTKKELKEALRKLSEDYQNRAFELTETAQGFLLQSKSTYKEYIQKLFQTPAKKYKLPASALEVLAIIAYKQPVTKTEVESIRGVDCSYPITILLERELCSNHKKLEAPGNPSLYETTTEFLRYFGLKSLGELPKID